MKALLFFIILFIGITDNSFAQKNAAYWVQGEDGWGNWETFNKYNGLDFKTQWNEGTCDNGKYKCYSINIRFKNRYYKNIEIKWHWCESNNSNCAYSISNGCITNINAGETEPSTGWVQYSNSTWIVIDEFRFY